MQLVQPRFMPFSQCLPPAYVLRRAKTSHFMPDIDGRNILTYTGTAALGLAAGSLKKSQRYHLLAPSYHCGHEIEPFLRHGFKVDIYRVDRSGRIDLNHLESLMRRKGQVVLVTHYFGFPQNIPEIADLCRIKGPWLIEDCAHAYLSRVGDRLLGSWGDLSIFSFRKSLPIPDGGAVFFKNTDIPARPPRQDPKHLVVWRKTAKLMTEQLLLSAEEKSGRMFNALKAVKETLLFIQSCVQAGRSTDNLAFYSPDDLSYDYSSKIFDWRISNVSLRILTNLDLESVYFKRRANYRYVLNRLNGNQWLRPLYSTLPEGVCPLIFPLVVEKKAANAQQVMAGHPFLFRTWLKSHPAVDGQSFKSSQWLRQNTYFLNIHQNMQKRHLDFLIDEAKKADMQIDSDVATLGWTCDG